MKNRNENKNFFSERKRNFLKGTAGVLAVVMAVMTAALTGCDDTQTPTDGTDETASYIESISDSTEKGAQGTSDREKNSEEISADPIEKDESGTGSASEKNTENSTKATEKATVKPTDKTTKPTAKPTSPTAKPTNPSTKPTVKPTQPAVKPTEKPTQKPTEPPTKPTEKPTEKPTQPPTQPPTEPPTESKTDWYSVIPLVDSHGLAWTDDTTNMGYFTESVWEGRSLDRVVEYISFEYGTLVEEGRSRYYHIEFISNGNPTTGDDWFVCYY